MGAEVFLAAGFLAAGAFFATVFAALGAADLVAVFAAGLAAALAAGFAAGLAAGFAAGFLAATGFFAAAAGFLGATFSLSAVFYERFSGWFGGDTTVGHTLAGPLTRPPIPLGRFRSPFSAPRLMALERLLMLDAELMSILYLSARNLKPDQLCSVRKLMRDSLLERRTRDTVAGLLGVSLDRLL